MRCSARRIVPLGFLLVGGSLACGDGPTVPDDFLPTFSNQWINVASPTHIFQLNSTDDGEPSGTFDGTETHPGFGNSPIEGTFVNSVAVLTIKRVAGDLVYAGKFLAEDTLRLTRTGETIVIARQ